MGKNYQITFQRQVRTPTPDNRLVDSLEITAITLPGEFPFMVTFPLAAVDEDLVDTELQRRAEQLLRIAAL